MIVLQVRNSGAAQPGGFVVLAQGLLYGYIHGRLRQEHPGKQNSIRLAELAPFFSVCSFQCGFSTWTVVDFLQHAASDILVGNSGLLARCPKREEQRLHGLFQPSLGGHSMAFKCILLGGGSHEGTPYIQKEEHRLCHLIGVVRFEKHAQEQVLL